MIGRKLLVVLAAFGLLLALPACEKKEKQKKKKKPAKKKKKKEKAKPVEPDPSKPATVGLVTVESDKSVDAVVKEMKGRLKKARSVEIIATVDHAANAKSVAEGDSEEPPLEATTLLLFTNPDLETPLINDSLTAGLDLPQKVLVWKGEGGKTNISFNAPSYVAKRHGVKRLDLFLGRLENGLSNVVENSSGATVPGIPKRPDIGIKKQQGVITRESNNGVTDTFETMVKFVEESDDLKLIAKVDHTANAKKVGRELRPAKLVVFGNPKMGTPLMKMSRTVGLDLPQKMFIYENEYGDILIAFNDPKFLAMRHGFDAKAEIVKKMDTALKKVAAKAAKEIE